MSFVCLKTRYAMIAVLSRNNIITIIIITASNGLRMLLLSPPSHLTHLPAVVLYIAVVAHIVLYQLNTSAGQLASRMAMA